MGGRGLAVAAAAIAMAAVLAMAAADGGITDFGEEDLASEETLRALYQRWRIKYSEYVQRRPATDDTDRRLRIFEKSARYVLEANKRNVVYTVALNFFSDMTDDEIAVYTTGELVKDDAGALGRIYKRCSQALFGIYKRFFV